MGLLFKGIKEGNSRLEVKPFLFLLRGRDAYKSCAGLYLIFIAAVKCIRTTETISYPSSLLAKAPLILMGLDCEDIFTNKKLLWIHSWTSKKTEFLMKNEN